MAWLCNHTALPCPCCIALLEGDPGGHGVQDYTTTDSTWGLARLSVVRVQCPLCQCVWLNASTVIHDFICLGCFACHAEVHLGMSILALLTARRCHGRYWMHRCIPCKCEKSHVRVFACICANSMHNQSLCVRAVVGDPDDPGPFRGAAVWSCPAPCLFERSLSATLQHRSLTVLWSYGNLN